MHDIHVDGGTLYQWDTGRRLYIDPRPGETVDEVHYSYSKSPDALNVYPEIVDGVITADIPNVILQTSGAFIAYVVMTTEDGSRTTHSCGFSVMARPKPDDYVHVEEDVLRYETLVKRLDDIEANGVPDEQVKAQVDQYFEENPVSDFNLVNGEAVGSVRSANSAKETDGYKLGTDAVALGYNTQASGNCAHAEGRSTKATNLYAHAEGYLTEATGSGSHAEGVGPKATGTRSHAQNCTTEANGDNSHAEGKFSKANGENSHAEGYGTVANSENQHVQGKYNVPDPDGRYAHIVGNGGGKFIPELIDYERSNAHTLDWDGNAWFAGNLALAGTSIVIKSSTEGSTKHFVLTVDDNGALSIVEAVE